MSLTEKCESIRWFGTEILRISRFIKGFEGVSDKISKFYESVLYEAGAGAVKSLEEKAKKDFERAKDAGPLSAAFFKRYNYLISCEAERIEEKFLKVTLYVSLKRASENIFYVENVHFWDIDGGFMVSEKGIKKALSKSGKIVKK